ncbi:hypothetical protein T484DRAFT_1876557, partial [Baffinella frigidus]
MEATCEVLLREDEDAAATAGFLSRSADQLTRELRSGGLGGVIVANISVAVAGEEEDVPEEEPEEDEVTLAVDEAELLLWCLLAIPAGIVVVCCMVWLVGGG